MAFDNSKPADLLALKTELELPAYMAIEGETRKLLHLLNDPTQNAGAENISTPLKKMMISAVGMEIDWGEYQNLTAYDKIWLKMLINRESGEEMEPFVKKFRALFAPASGTMSAVDVVRSHPASRGEVLFGEGTHIVRHDLNAARDS